MRSINMIAARRAEKKRLEKLVQAVALVIIGEVAITLAVFGILTTHMFSARREIKRLDTELAKVQPIVNQIRAYEQDIKKLEPRLVLLEDSKKQTLLWHTILGDLGRSMPENTWLVNLMTSRPVDTGGSSDKPTPGPTINLRGMTMSQKLVGEAMLRLNQCSEFERIDLNYTQKSTSANFDGVEFQVAALLKSSEQGKGGTQKNATN